MDQMATSLCLEYCSHRHCARICSRGTRPLWFLLALVALLPLSCAEEALDGDSCHARGSQEYCPVDRTCHPDSDCEHCEGHLTEDPDEHECIFRRPFTSHLVVDCVAAIIWFFGAGLATSAGVGGGGIFVPLGIILLRFASKPSTGLSQASIFGASLAGLLINMRSRHPKADRPLIDIDMALFLSPMQMAGALLGVILQRVLPTWAVILAMVLILGYTAVKTGNKGLSMLREERQARADGRGLKRVEVPKEEEEEQERAVGEDKQDGGNLDAAENPAQSSLNDDEAANGATNHAGKGPRSGVIEKQKLVGEAGDASLSAEDWLARDAQAQWGSAGFLLLMWLVVIGLIIAKGGKGSPGLFEYCTRGYWLCTCVSFFWMFGFSVLMGRRVVRKTAQKAAAGYPFVEGDIMWDFTLFKRYCIITFIAGLVAGLIGIGGGMVLGPVMLQLGVPPQVSAATNATMILLSSSPTALAFITSGLVPWRYATIFFVVAFLGSYAGKSYIDALVKKYQMTAIIVLILAGIIAFASAMTTLNGVIIYRERAWDFEGFNALC